MKVLLEILIICLLVIVGWRQPFAEHYARIRYGPQAPPARASVRQPLPSLPAAFPAAPAVQAPQATPSRDSSWMWERRALDPNAR